MFGAADWPSPYFCRSLRISLASAFPGRARGGAVAAFMPASGVSGVVGGPISGALLSLHGAWGLDGWQWLFLLGGLPAIVLGFVVL